MALQDTQSFDIPDEVLEHLDIPKDENETLLKQQQMKREYIGERIREQKSIYSKERAEQNAQLKEMYNSVGFQSGADIVKPKRTTINKPIKQVFNDVEPAWRADRVTHRKSWPEFCRDFLGQNFGSIAQAMLELSQRDKVQFLKFAMEMGKQGYPQAMQVEMSNANATEGRGDIYKTLQAMSAPIAQIESPQSHVESRTIEDNTEDGQVYHQERERAVEPDLYGENGNYCINPALEGVEEIECQDLDDIEHCDCTEIRRCLQCELINECKDNIAEAARAVAKADQKTNKQTSSNTNEMFAMFAALS